MTIQEWFDGLVSRNVPTLIRDNGVVYIGTKATIVLDTHKRLIKYIPFNINLEPQPPVTVSFGEESLNNYYFVKTMKQWFLELE